jgi:hypothetical protein
MPEWPQIVGAEWIFRHFSDCAFFAISLEHIRESGNRLREKDMRENKDL